jgi:hypothetical protein
MLGKFVSYQLASLFAYNTSKFSAIVLGDDFRYWVVTMAKMEELIEQGYEVVK